MSGEPLPRSYDYQGNKRGDAYIRGVTHVRCNRCKTTGVDPVPNDPTNVCGNLIGTDIPVCRSCGGYGCVPANTTKIEDKETVGDTVTDILIGAAILDAFDSI